MIVVRSVRSVGAVTSAMSENEGKQEGDPKADNAAQQQPKSKKEQEGSDAQVKLTHLLDPYNYALKRVHIRAELAKLPIGMKTETKAPGVVKVSELKKGGIAEAHGLEVGLYLLCANGRQCTGDEDDLKPNEHGLRMTVVRKRRNPLSPEMPYAFLGRYQRQLGCDYMLLRVNLIACKLAAFHITKGKGGRACLGISSDRTAIGAFGLRVGDVIVAADWVPVRDKGHCEALLRATQNDIVDLAIERPRTVAIPVINVKVPDSLAHQEFSLSSDDDVGGFGGFVQVSDSDADAVLGLGLEEEMGGDPEMGVPPNIPTDVARILKGSLSLDLAKKIINTKKSLRPVGVNKAAIAAEQPLTLSTQETRVVKIAKKIDTSKLKRGSTSPTSKKMPSKSSPSSAPKSSKKPSSKKN